jgi:pyruvate formate lyase activating enzyme
MDSGTEYTLAQIYEIIDENDGIVDSLVATGGEPTLQYHDLVQICRIGKEMGYDVMLDTNGIETNLIHSLVMDGLVDRVAIDAKVHMRHYPAWEDQCGIDKFTAMKIEETMDIISKIPKCELEIRTTVVPGTWSDPISVPYIIDSIVEYADEYHLQQFDSTDPLDKTLQGRKTVSKEKLERLAEYALEQGIPKVVIKTKEGTDIRQKI